MQTTNPQADVPLLTSEVARILNKSTETIRCYERTGRLHAVRTATGVRLFSRQDVERLGEALKCVSTLSAALARIAHGKLTREETVQEVASATLARAEDKETKG